MPTPVPAASADILPNLSFWGHTWSLLGQTLKIYGKLETSWCSHIMKPPRHHFCVDFAMEMAPNGTLGPIFGLKWLEMANYEQRRPFWAQHDLGGKWDWFWYFLCIIWIGRDSFCSFFCLVKHSSKRCPAGTRTRPATRYFFRYLTRPDSVLEITG